MMVAMDNIRQVAKVAAYLGWDVDETARDLARDHGVTEAEAKEVLLNAMRERDEIELRDTADEILHPEDYQGGES